MKTVVLVGAGATVAETMTKNLGKKRLPPLDKTFFSLARTNNRANFGPLAKYVKSNFGLDLTGAIVSMEEVYNLIYTKVMDAVPPDKAAVTALDQLLKLYRNSIADTTNPLKSNGASGIFGLIHKLALDSELENTTFVTFNHDLMIEKALHKILRTKRFPFDQLDLKHCYGLKFDGSIKMLLRGDTFDYGEKNQEARIYKLHGSMNWFRSVKSKDSARNSLSVKTKKVYCCTSVNIFDGIYVEEEGDPIFHIPVIVPPVYEKMKYYADILRPVWANAMLALSKASRVIIFGYSFPDADVKARCSISGALAKNKVLSNLSIVDVDPSICEKIVRITGRPSLHYYSNVRLLA